MKEAKLVIIKIGRRCLDGGARKRDQNRQSVYEAGKLKMITRKPAGSRICQPDVSKIQRISSGFPHRPM